MTTFENDKILRAYNARKTPIQKTQHVPNHSDKYITIYALAQVCLDFSVFLQDKYKKELMNAFEGTFKTRRGMSEQYVRNKRRKYIKSSMKPYMDCQEWLYKIVKQSKGSHQVDTIIDEMSDEITNYFSNYELEHVYALNHILGTFLIDCRSMHGEQKFYERGINVLLNRYNLEDFVDMARVCDYGNQICNTIIKYAKRSQERNEQLARSNSTESCIENATA